MGRFVGVKEICELPLLGAPGNLVQPMYNCYVLVVKVTSRWQLIGYIQLPLLLQLACYVSELVTCSNWLYSAVAIGLPYCITLL